MPGLGKGFAVAVRYLRPLRGGSQPFLAQASDGHQYVLKFANNPQGSNLIFNEVMGTELYRACRLPVPQWKPILVLDEFIDSNPDCWFQSPNGALRPQPGLCFGSRFLGEQAARIYEILPATRFARIRNRDDFWMSWLVDVCARHTDHRQAVFLEQPDSRLRAVFVDQGCMFGGVTGAQPSHVSAPRYLDRRIYPKIGLNALMSAPALAERVNPRALWSVIDALPTGWKADSGVESLVLCLEKLTNPRALREIFDTLVFSLPGPTGHAEETPHPEPRATYAFLHARVHPPGRAHRAVA